MNQFVRKHMDFYYNQRVMGIRRYNVWMDG